MWCPGGGPHRRRGVPRKIKLPAGCRMDWIPNGSTSPHSYQRKCTICGINDPVLTTARRQLATRGLDLHQAALLGQRAFQKLEFFLYLLADAADLVDHPFGWAPH